LIIGNQQEHWGDYERKSWPIYLQAR
jgi:hypothetical protein